MDKKGRWWKFWRFIEIGESFLVKTIIGVLVTLVVLQAMFTSDIMRFYLSFAERLEGEPFVGWSQPITQVMEEDVNIFASLTVELKDYSSLPKAKLLLNGVEIADFQRKKITFKVIPEDIITVDGTFYQHPLTFEIIEVSPCLSHPILHQKISTNSSKKSFTRVKFK